jgi:retrograde regulation protein 2
VFHLGGSTQITYLTTNTPDHEPTTSTVGSISFPYGAAAMTQRLSTLHTQAQRDTLAETITDQFRQAYKDLQLPEHMSRRAAHGGLPLYLSGGGFRGWGYLHMAQHRVSPYPIPIINGFSIGKSAWSNTRDIEELARLTLTLVSPTISSPTTITSPTTDNETSSETSSQHHHAKQATVFRVSKRRAAQVPAVAFLINCLTAALPFITDVRFCQGGVREGWLYTHHLPPALRSQDPLCAATAQFNNPYPSQSYSATQPLTPSAAAHIASLLHAALPTPESGTVLNRALPPLFDTHLTRALADTMYLGLSHPKETRSLNALMLPLTGALASAHGVGHAQRAILALALAARWGDAADIPAPFDGVRERLERVLTPQEAWWAGYLGRVAGVVGGVYPSGRIGPSPSNGEENARERLKISAVWAPGLGKKGLQDGVRVSLRAWEGEVMMGREGGMMELIEEWEKVGKKKHWVRGFGVVVEVSVERVNWEVGAEL